jgi:transcriptional regulator with XRE-family HTH domain
MERSEWVIRFRERLTALIEREGLSRAAFAARIGLDRSTLSQLLSPENARLPRAETIAALAREMQVSADWLLGLTETGRPDAELVPETLQVEPGGASPMDERLQRWHAEARGYKIRYVPTTLPDLLKTADVIAYETPGPETAVPEYRQRQAESELAYSRLPETDMETCCAWQTVAALARGEGIWSGLSLEARRAQLAHAIDLADELYPTFRWFLYDGRERFSVPFTIFGPQRTAVYVGDMYFVFNATEHIRVMTRHFDSLIRSASVPPTEVVGYLKSLLAEMT